ncbi:dipeptidase [Massilia sp. PAMC28688]|uniref:dipeptidase n=1 Tax=Massilia sp. PAMC28688 TaxID=2861283 RepID=UPI001C62B592|nr:dipeptidase [Massilia sp. PAMC28688]QYF94180.1 dipeptidase [Massilia sp. PAMC28688]
MQLTSTFFQPLVAAALLCLLQGGAAAGAPAAAQVPGPAAIKAARHAVTTYRKDVVDSLAAMVSFNTVADKDVPFESNPQHLGFKKYLKDHAARLGLDYADHGYIVIIGLGAASERVGIITHGDIQPVDPTKWKKSPFVLDRTSEPGRLIGRGTEDDKGPIATAMYAMKAIKDQKIALSKRLELYVYMAEESDWTPLSEFLKTHVPPQINITIDAEYPVVTAEKGYGSIRFTVPRLPLPDSGAYISEFGGGFFGSQIPEDARAVLANVPAPLEAAIRRRAAAQAGMRYTFTPQGSGHLRIEARGISAHSSKPQDGLNAVSMLAAALDVQPWPATTAATLVTFLNDMIGTGIHAEKFGGVAYRDPFMGPMTLAPTVIKDHPDGTELTINLRRPRGKSNAEVEAQLRAALAAWQQRRAVALDKLALYISEPWVQASAPQVPTLLSVFSHYTGVRNPQPVSVGGGTNSRLFPSAVSFGPAMPGKVYTGHSEHEFITMRQLLLNLQMYTAALVELAK